MRKLMLIALLFAFAFAGLHADSRPALALDAPTPTPEAAPSQAAQPAGQSQDNLATWQKIDAAYEQGLISADERQLYLLYAVFDPDKLPPVYNSDVPWDATQVVRELGQTYAEIQAGNAPVSSSTAAEFERLLAPSATNALCGETDGANTVDSTNFRFSYGTISGGLTINDYITALETTFAKEVASYGWAQPPYSSNNAFHRYPVQVAPLGSSAYGYTAVGYGSFTGLVGDNPNTPAVETEAMASCMVLNSNFNLFPLGALASLQVTAAHEFVHAIQYGWGDPGSMEDTMFYESTAAYAEDEVYNSINDNYQYLPPVYSSCLGQYSDPSGRSYYSNWLFFRYAAEANGGVGVAGGGEDVFQGLWTNIAAGASELNAMNSGLALKGSTLADTYHKYAITARFMQSCPTSSPYCFKEAAGYVGQAGRPSNNGSIGSIGGSYTGSVKNNYAINWVGLPTSGKYSVALTSSGSGSLRASVVAQTSSGLTVTAFPGVATAGATQTLTGYTPPAGATLVVAVITNQSQTAGNPASCAADAYTLATSVYSAPLPGAFAKTAPANGATGQSTSLTLSWGSSSDATSYEYCYDTSNDSACAGSWVSAGANTSANLSGLSAATSYYWQARARNAAGTTDASGGWWSFATLPLPGSFAKLTPANGSTNVSKEPPLSWGSSANAASYEICYDTSNDGACSRSWVNVGAATNTKPSGLHGGTSYYWQVRARNLAGTTDASSGWWSFTTQYDPPGAFSKSSPATASTLQPLASVTLTWAASDQATGYAFCLDNNPNSVCDSFWTSIGNITNTTVSELSPLTTYAWQVRASNPTSTTLANNGAWYTFTTEDTPAGAFLKATPPGGALDQSTSLTLTWGLSSGASGYEYCLDGVNDSICNTTWISAGAQLSATVSNLNYGTPYYWQVRAVKPQTIPTEASGGWWQFTTLFHQVYMALVVRR